MLAVFLYLLFCLSGCSRTKETQLLLLEEGVSDGGISAKEALSGEAQAAEESGIPGTAKLPGNSASGQTDAFESVQGQLDVQEPSMITVHVCGAVTAPGVYELKVPARVVDAIAEAGGFDEQAAEAYLNQASFLTDGQQVYVPTEEEAEQAFQLPASADTGMAGTQAGAAETEVTGININTASKEELMNLPGIGEAKAESILRYRESSGGFRAIEDIMQVEGIKEGLFYKMQERICVGP